MQKNERKRFNINDLTKSRIVLLYKLIFFCFILLCMKFAYYQIIRGNQLYDMASSQRLKSIRIERQRGDIYDRKGIRFTNRETKNILIISPVVLEYDEKDLKTIANTIGHDVNNLKDKINNAKQPVVYDINYEEASILSEADIKGVYVLNTLLRYGKDSLATHAIGYLNNVDGNGVYGIEKYYDKILDYNTFNSVSAYIDAENRVINHLGIQIVKSDSKDKKLNLRLTLDYNIQKIAEDTLENKDITGAVVIQNVNTGDIVAIASKEDFDRDNIVDYLNSSNSELFNRASASYNLGSIFKAVVLAAAYENNIKMSKHNCKGYVDVNGIRFKCASYDSGGHGILSIDEAFALSCNSYFINLAMKTGYFNILDMAQRFGLGEATGLNKQGILESEGTLPQKNAYYSHGDIANIAIGQGDILASPIQIAGMIATIANGGIRNNVNIVDSIVDENNNIVKSLRVDSGKRIMKKDTADKIKKMMEGVLDFGTGKSIMIGDKYGNAAGKTGSAETGQFIEGYNVVHAWFGGYFPRSAPKYSVAVIVENGRSGSKIAAPIFEEIANQILRR